MSPADPLRPPDPFDKADFYSAFTPPRDDDPITPAQAVLELMRMLAAPGDPLLETIHRSMSAQNLLQVSGYRRVKAGGFMHVAKRDYDLDGVLALLRPWLEQEMV